MHIFSVPLIDVQLIEIVPFYSYNKQFNYEYNLLESFEFVYFWGACLFVTQIARIGLTNYFINLRSHILSRLSICTMGIGSESSRTTMFNMYYNGIKRMLRDGCTGIPNLSRTLTCARDSNKRLYFLHSLLALIL